MKGTEVPQFTADDGARLFFDDSGAGAGPAVLCLSGLTRNHRDFDHVRPHLIALGARVVRMDYRGRGLSDRTGPATYTVAREAADVVGLLDHLGLSQVAVLGTSRGGLVAMVLAAMARDRLAGVALNDIGPEIAPGGMAVILSYLGRRPAQRTHAEAAAARAAAWTGFRGVPPERWLAEVRGQFDEGPDGLMPRYDLALREAVLAAGAGPAPDLWPLFDALAGLPLALIRGETSDILSRATAEAMAARRPDMIRAEVPGRGHVPFLDEAESLAALTAWWERMR